MPAVEGIVNTGYHSDIPSTDKAVGNDGHYIMTRCSTSHILSQSHTVEEVDNSREQELMHASNMSLSHSASASSISNKSIASSALKVEVSVKILF